MTRGVLIVTPSNMREAMSGRAGDFVVSDLVRLEPAVDSEFRHARDEIFNDLPYVSPNEPELFSAYLDGIADPIDRLQRLGLGIYAVVTRGSLALPALHGNSPSQERVPWERVHFFVVPLGGMFRVQDGIVHRFEPCAPAVDALGKAVREKLPISVWWDAKAVRLALERNVPWCQECCLDEAAR